MRGSVPRLEAHQDVPHDDPASTLEMHLCRRIDPSTALLPLDQRASRIKPRFYGVEVYRRMLPAYDIGSRCGHAMFIWGGNSSSRSHWS